MSQNFGFAVRRLSLSCVVIINQNRSQNQVCNDIFRLLFAKKIMKCARTYILIKVIKNEIKYENQTVFFVFSSSWWWSSLRCIRNGQKKSGEYQIIPTKKIIILTKIMTIKGERSIWINEIKLVYNDIRSFISECVHICFPSNDVTSVSCLFFSHCMISRTCQKHSDIMNNTNYTVPYTPDKHYWSLDDEP